MSVHMKMIREEWILLTPQMILGKPTSNFFLPLTTEPDRKLVDESSLSKIRFDSANDAQNCVSNRSKEDAQ